MGAALEDRQYDPPLPVVDLVTGRCLPGKVSRTVSRIPLTLDFTVVCVTSAVVPPPPPGDLCRPLLPMIGLRSVPASAAPISGEGGGSCC